LSEKQKHGHHCSLAKELRYQDVVSNLSKVTEGDCRRLMIWPCFSCAKFYPIPKLQDCLPYKTTSAGLQLCWTYHASFLS